MYQIGGVTTMRSIFNFLTWFVLIDLPFLCACACACACVRACVCVWGGCLVGFDGTCKTL